MKKIVIVPSFADLHFFKCWLPNVQEVIEPDHIIINVGLFPQGPENKGNITPEFREKWCHPDMPYVGFDYDDVVTLCQSYDNVAVNPINYQDSDANKCFLTAISNGLPEIIEVGDLVFPLEPDAFQHEVNKKEIREITEALKPGQGIATKWVDFLETQFYTETINLDQPKYRRFCYCFDNLQNYRSAMDAFMTQNYSRLRRIDDFITYHYCWLQPPPYKQLRFDLIHRSDPKYWEAFSEGLDEIAQVEVWGRRFIAGDVYDTRGRDIPSFITIRPSRQDAGRYASFIDISHPKHIHSHPNFVK